MSGSIFASEPAGDRGRIGLPIKRQPAPTLPTLIRPLPEKPLMADGIDNLARHIHRLKGDNGLRIGPLQFASYGGSDTFPGFYLYAIDPDSGTETWVGLAAVQSETDAGLRAALARTEQRRAA